MDKAALASELIVEALIKKKEELQMTCAQLAEKSGLPESTVVKVFNHGIKSPSIDTLSPLADALDLSIDKALNKAVNTVVENTVASKTIPATMLVSQEDKFLNLFLETHNKQITDLKEQIDHKEKWIRFLVSLLVIMTLLFVVVIVYDIVTHDTGWFQYPTALELNGLNNFKKALLNL